MSDDHSLKALPFASDDASIYFSYGNMTLCGVLLMRRILKRRYHISAVRYCAWGIPAGFCLFYISYPALAPSAREFVWSMGLKGKIFPPYPEYAEEDE